MSVSLDIHLSKVPQVEVKKHVIESNGREFLVAAIKDSEEGIDLDIFTDLYQLRSIVDQLNEQLTKLEQEEIDKDFEKQLTGLYCDELEKLRNRKVREFKITDIRDAELFSMLKNIGYFDGGKKDGESQND